MKEPQGKKEYYAKSNPLILNKDHLAEVGKLAERYGEEIGRKEEAGVAGRLHDFGKYSDRFQGVLLGTHHGIDHAVGGAVYLYLRKNKARVRYTAVIESILGHHDGLRSMDELDAMWQAENYAACLTQKEPALSTKEEYLNAKKVFGTYHFPEFSAPELPGPAFHYPVEAMLDTRMLFSCLVDADYTISALEKNPEYLKESVGQALDAEASLRTLFQHMEKLRKNSTAKESLNRLREQVFTTCGEMGERCEPGLFRLTAPTGVGKTMAMLHFALRHCQTHGLRRIIVVLPFLTLAEQTEEEYKELIPGLLVDHSQKDLPEAVRELAARWDAPLVITTSVRFFESLFSDRPTACRKLHHIANSVVLFDEAQSLPAQLAPATLRAVNRLCERYHCTMLFASPPKWEQIGMGTDRAFAGPCRLVSPDAPGQCGVVLGKGYSAGGYCRRNGTTEQCVRHCKPAPSRQDSVSATFRSVRWGEGKLVSSQHGSLPGSSAGGSGDHQETSQTGPALPRGSNSVH